MADELMTTLVVVIVTSNGKVHETQWGYNRSFGKVRVSSEMRRTRPEGGLVSQPTRELNDS